MDHDDTSFVEVGFLRSIGFQCILDYAGAVQDLLFATFRRDARRL